MARAWDIEALAAPSTIRQWRAKKLDKMCLLDVRKAYLQLDASAGEEMYRVAGKRESEDIHSGSSRNNFITQYLR